MMMVVFTASRVSRPPIYVFSTQPRVHTHCLSG